MPQNHTGMAKKKEEVQEQVQNTAPQEKKKRQATSGSFEKGHKKAGGRQKGTPNKMTTNLRRILEAQLRPHIEKLNSYIDSIKEPDKKAAVLAQWAPYILPKLSNITLGEDGQRDITTEEYLKELNSSYKKADIHIDVAKVKIVNNG